MLARIIHALVNVLRTSETFEAERTSAFEFGAILLYRTCAAILARR